MLGRISTEAGCVNRLQKLLDHGQAGSPPKEGLPTIHSVAESGGFSDLFVLRSSEFLGESDEKPFRPADVAEPIRVFILDYIAYELRAALAEPFKRLVDVVHGEHHAKVA
ncbi:MAG: hypothetical protein WB586_09500 [Chthoniobacterales bacterium]|jgi:hypothetical protein